jgi:beta-lactamase class A
MRAHLIIVVFISMILATSCTSAKYSTTPAMEINKLNNQSSNFQTRTDSFLTNLLHAYPQFFDSLIKQNKIWQIQIIYTQIDRDRTNIPSFNHFFYNVNPSQYFYPASTVKLPTAILALQKLNELNIKRLTRDSTMITETGYNGWSGVYNEPTNSDGRPSIAHYIKKILLVSDNDAYNRLYEFLGQEYLNNTLAKMGYDSTEIIHRLNIAMSEEQNRYTNPIRFIDTSGQVIYMQPLIRSTLTHHQRHHYMGKGYYSGGKLVQEPFNFSKKNRLALSDLHSMVQSIIFPDAVPKRQRFDLTADDYRFLHTYMSMYPKESAFPSYDSSYNDAYVKFLFYGAKDPVKPNIRIFNKVGDAYGFLIDAAYIVDFDNKVEFLLSAVIHCNSDGIYNDDKYEYEQVGFPFMKHLGEVIYEYEKTRKRSHLPDLSSFKMSYGN